MSMRLGVSEQGGEWLPFGNDSFYHAHRILAVARGEPLAQFDPAIQVPAGSWITWPWSYDWILGKTLALLQWFAPSTAPMTLLAFLPMLGLGASLGLLLAIARRLQLGVVPSALAAVTFGLAPLMLANHMPGAVDHHWAEASFVLACVWSGMRWHATGSWRDALLHGVVLAAAQGVQNGLFVLQAFTLAALGFAWLRSTLPPARSIEVFAVALIGGTLLLVLPSEPFWQGFGEFWFLGRFHLLTASGSALFAFALSRAPLTHGGSAVLAGLGVLVLAGMASQMQDAGSFVGAESRDLQTIRETASVFTKLGRSGLLDYLATQTLLPLLAPLALLPMLRRAWDEPELRWFVAFALPGCALQLMQTRFWSFGLGLAALALAWSVQRVLQKSREPAATRAFAVLLVGAAVLAPTAKGLGRQYPPGGSEWFLPLQPMIAPLREACAVAPRVVLADANFGHLITYLTGCRVMANNFIMSPADYRSRARVERLFSLEPAAFLAEAREVDYVLVGVQGPRTVLGEALLDLGPVPPGFTQRAETVSPPNMRLEVTMRLFEVRAQK